MQPRNSFALTAALAATLLVRPALGQVPLGSDFTYQGRLNSAGAALDGTADFQFRLFDANAGGAQIGPTVPRNALTIADGLFTASLDFGPDAFDGNARWLQIAVRSPAGSGTFTTLTPRQALNAAPYALKVPGIDGHSLAAADGSPVDAVFVNDAGRVGVGTVTPQSQLHVVQNWDGENGALRLGGDRPTLRLDGGAIAGNQTWLMHVGSDGPGALQFFRRPTGSTTWLNMLNIQPSGNVGIGSLTPNFPLSLGTSLSHTKIALYDAGPTNHFGMGVVSGQFSFHLNGAGARYAFYDSDDLTNEIFTIFGNGTTRVKVLEITGADLAEKFPASEVADRGMVMAIDPSQPGKLCLARGAYNRCVAGIVSGANDFAVGAILGNLPGQDDAPPIALSGRVYVWCDASDAAIEPGDLLTTSDTPGHAMKSLDPGRAAGAVLGKAMTPLACGQRGLVLALVSLQ
jgi:hypothetical protein